MPRDLNVSMRGRPLSDRQRERRRLLVDLVCQGLADKEIARVLDVSPGVARNLVAVLLRSYGVPTRTRLQALLHERNLREAAARAALAATAVTPGSAIGVAQLVEVVEQVLTAYGYRIVKEERRA